MPRITFIAADAVERTVEAKIGDSVMQTAIKNGVPGIDADCGGACACATCHVFVHASWVARLGEMSAMETSMLDFAQGVRPDSRLSCQIEVTESLDGLIVSTPEGQH
jgi:ferredoxin, 2Fe-2S